VDLVRVLGLERGVYVAGEVRDPERNLPRALLSARASSTAAYLALNAVFLYRAHFHELAGRREVGAIAAEALGGHRAAALPHVDRGARALHLGLVDGHGRPRVYARMAADGVLPRSSSSRRGPRRARSSCRCACPSPSFGSRSCASCSPTSASRWACARPRPCSASCACGCARVPSASPSRLARGPGALRGHDAFASFYLAQREPRQALIGAATAAIGFVLPRIWKR
jgi:hypothetical protein